MKAGLNLRGQVAVISGGLGDIGRAIAFELAHCGADIAIGDVLPERKTTALLRQIQRLGRRFRYDQVDVSNARAVARWLSSIEKTLGVPTLIIPNAAIVTLATLRELTPAQWRHELSINLDGVFHLAQAGALRLVAKKKPGRVVVIGSWAAHTPHAHIPAYCVAKAGLRMLVKQMAVEFAGNDILVNEVAPGYVDGGLSGRGFDRDLALKRRTTKQVPIRRLIKPEEVALEVAHLCDPRNRHMTGSVMLMDGGLSLR